MLVLIMVLLTYVIFNIHCIIAPIITIESYKPHFSTARDSKLVVRLDIHFLHVKPTKPGNKKVVPLLLLHGWPGSVREFYELIPLLTSPSKDHDYVFEVIAPSLVGFGWSQGAAKQGLGPAQMAVIFRNLMLRIGHERFLIQGGDWGSVVGSDLATFFPQNTIGYHSNMCLNSGLVSIIKLFIASLYPPVFFEKRQEKFHLPIGQKFIEFIEESGYLHLQATKPDTIGTVLLNNPSGLAAYILEKVSTFTNLQYRQLPDGGLEKRYTLDALLDNIMVYYLTNSINTAQRLYSEAFSRAQRSMQLERVPVTVPTGCARFEYDMWGVSDWQLKGKYVNLVHSSYHDDGGHFAALEVPKVLYKDFVKFVKKVLIRQ